jgi:predicted regulator of Ras-like GTPase activity (Roadblock/LC7/MglB family)
VEEKPKTKSSTQKIEEPIVHENQDQEKLELQEIPIEEEKPNLFSNLDEIPIEASEIPSETVTDLEEKNPPILQEITPKPFQGRILSAKKETSFFVPKSKDIITDAFTELKQSVLEVESRKPKPSITPLPQKDIDSDSEVAIIKQKKLEKDMSEVLGFLSKKIAVNKIKPKEPKSTSKKEPEHKLPPASMNEILKELISLDSRIEASAIIRTDGTMLASAISSRISESLFGTIGINLSMISSDIIHGLSAGTLKSISVKGTEGILDLAFLDLENSNLKDMILILFSHPQVKSGIISIAINLIKKQVKYYLGLEK